LTPVPRQTANLLTMNEGQSATMGLFAALRVVSLRECSCRRSFRFPPRLTPANWGGRGTDRARVFRQLVGSTWRNLPFIPFRLIPGTHLPSARCNDRVGDLVNDAQDAASATESLATAATKRAARRLVIRQSLFTRWTVMSAGPTAVSTVS
jgi:hypothetical protein